MKGIWKKVWCVFMVCSMVISLAACSGGSSETEVKESKSASSDEGKSLIYISRSMSDAFASWLANTVKSEGEKRGYSVSILDEEDDAAKAIEMLENARTQNPDAIILQPTADFQGLSTIKSIEEDGIPVIVVNVTLSEDPNAVPTVICDDYMLGYKIAQLAAKNLPENANVVILNGISGFSVSVDRRKGFQEGLLDARPDVTLLDEQSADFNKDDAMNVMDDWLQKYDNIDGVIAASDGMAIGAIESYKSNNMDFSNVQFYGIDGLADGCLSVQASELTGTVLQDANLMANTTLDELDKILDDSVTEPEIVSIDAMVIDKSNVDDVIKMHQENGLID